MDGLFGTGKDVNGQTIGGGGLIGGLLGSLTGKPMAPQRAEGGVTNNYVDARYSDIGGEQRIMAAMARIEAKRPSEAAQTVAYQRRFPTRRG